ncbi:MAG: hypothetical protein QGI73_04765, partial [Candidatus Thalassarchaeaceae archaeon]|nr:hypothetical protein [Candidatus Thalassarchaeaceae archaeon]
MPRDWSIRVALLLVSIMSIQTISLGGGTILGVPPQGLVDSEQNEEIDNGRSEKIYVNFQIDALS